MELKLDEEELRAMVQEESEKPIRKRIREMQGQYTSKGYLEEVMREILWDTLTEKIPNLEAIVIKSIDEIIKEKKRCMEVPSKSDLIDAIIEALKYSDD